MDVKANRIMAAEQLARTFTFCAVGAGLHCPGRYVTSAAGALATTAPDSVNLLLTVVLLGERNKDHLCLDGGGNDP